MKVSLITWAVIVALTLAICLFFYYASPEQLSGPAITVVAGFSVAVVYGVKWLVRTLIKRRRPK